jgi:tyrosine-protein kinase Etk/Wzc
MNATQPTQARPMMVKKPMEIGYYVRHYAGLFWRWKWYIALVTPAIIAAWSYGAIKYGQSRPSLESKAVLQFMHAGNGMGPIDEQTINLERQSCEAFIRSRPFLESIMEKHSLQLVVEKYFRNDIFDSIQVDKNAPVGRYDFVLENDGYTLYFTNKHRGIDKRVVMAGKLFELTSFSFTSLSLKLTHDFLNEPHSFTFNILNARDAVDRILVNLTITFPGSGEERESPIMVVTLKGGDYPLITKTLNSIADDFVANNAELKRSKKSEDVQVLEKQLEAARNDLNGADEAMRRFREANPSVGAASIVTPSMSEMTNLENSLTAINRSIDDAVNLQSRCNTAPASEEQFTALFEAITFLTTHQSAAAPGLQVELNEANAEKRRIDADYSPQHPIAIENRKKNERLTSRISQALSEVIEKMRADVASAATKKTNLSAEFQKLPEKEMRYAELERKRSTLAELYSNMLARYNVNRMSETSRSGDVAVLDHAVAALSPGRLETLLRLLLLGVGVGLFLGFGPCIGLDYLDKRARSEDDCRRFSFLPFLEGIPAKEGRRKKGKAEKGKVDAYLVDSGFEPGLFDDMYRSLRTKILLHLHDEPRKMLVITSLNIGDGKSLTASNIAIVMAQQKLKTLLIDGDLRRGVQHHSFLLEKKPGLSEILSSPDDLASMPISAMIQKTHVPNLSVLSSGMPIPNPSECMNSQKFRDLSLMLAEWFEVVILDTPPLLAAVDAAMLPEAFNHYIMVARVAKTDIAAIDKKVNEFPGLRRKILGMVLNGVAMDKKLSTYRYSYYH